MKHFILIACLALSACAEEGGYNLAERRSPQHQFNLQGSDNEYHEEYNGEYTR